MPVRLALTFPAKIADRSRYHTLAANGSSKRGTDLADISELILPPESGRSLGTKKGSYFLGYNFQQYIWQDPNKLDGGWGIFGNVGLGDGNPNPLRWMMLAGVGGTGLIPGRNLDRFGVGYFRYSFSEDLSDGLRLFGLKLGDEHGGELFYEGKAAVSAELAPVFKIDRREYLKSNYSAVSLAEAVRQLLPKAEVTAVSGAGVVPKEPTDNSGRSRCSAECRRRHPRRRRPIGMVQRAHRRRRL